IKRNVLRIDLGKRCLHPGDKTALNSLWINPCKDAIKRIMRWNASRKCQKGMKPLLLRVGDNCYFREGICTTDGTTDGHDEDFNQDMTFVVIFAIIRNDTEVCD